MFYRNPKTCTKITVSYQHGTIAVVSSDIFYHTLYSALMQAKTERKDFTITSSEIGEDTVLSYDLMVELGATIMVSSLQNVVNVPAERREGMIMLIPFLCK